MSAPTIYGLIGYPVKHSFSPAMHNAAFAALGINAQYKLFTVAPNELESFLERAQAHNLDGFNVTVPHKEAVLDFVELDMESFYLKQVKAVNTIVKRNGRWKGFNTDIAGFSKHMKEQYDLSNKKVALIGAGGGARAVSYVLAKERVREIAVFDVARVKSEALIAMIKSIFPDCTIYSVQSIEGLDIINKDVLINATPIGLKNTDSVLVDEKMLHKGLFVYDLIYNPALTPLLKAAQKKGARYSNGLGMLLYQGTLAFKHFTGMSAPIEVMRQALKEAF